MIVLRFPADRIIGLRYRLSLIHIFDLHFVVIRKRYEMLQFPAAGQHSRFPDLPFLAFPVPDAGVSLQVLLIQLRRQCHANRCGESLPQGAGGHVDSIGKAHIAVAGQMSVRTVQGVQFLLWKKSSES